MKAERLPSGNWRVRVYLGQKNGKAVRKSVTGRTRQEALRKAGEYVVPEYDEDLTLEDACRSYLETRGPELSPATVRGYEGTLRRWVEKDPIGAVKLEKIKTPVLQAWVSRMGAKKKTKLNHLGFVEAVINYFIPSASFRVRVGDDMQEELYTPTFSEVNRVLSFCDPDTAKAMMLGIFGLRRGEICALTQEDLQRGERCFVRITKDVVKGPDGVWVVKVPKTRKSVRWVEIPPKVMDLLPKDGPVISCSPDCITNRFARAVRRAGVPHFRLHDLRAFFATVSVSPMVGASEKSVQNIGGWATNNILKSHYERTISDLQDLDAQKILRFFGERLSV